MGQFPRQPAVMHELTGAAVLVPGVSVLNTYKVNPLAVPTTSPSVVVCRVNVLLAPPAPALPPLGSVPPLPPVPPLDEPALPASPPDPALPASPAAPASFVLSPAWPAVSFVPPP